MRKTIVLALVLTLSFTSLSAQALRFNTRNFYPFSYQAGQRISGPVADLIREICQNAKIECSFKLMDWTAAQEAVEQGLADGLFVLGWNKNRAVWLRFTPQILRTEFGFFTSADNPLQFKDKNDVSGMTVGVYGPSNTSRLLEEINKRLEKDTSLASMRVKVFADQQALFRDLNSSNRTITAVYDNRDAGNAIKKNLGLINVLYAGTERKLDYYIAFSKRSVDKKLVYKFNVELVKLYKSGKLKEFLDYYGIEQGKIEPHILGFYSK